MSKEARDNAIERVGIALYGESWIGSLGKEEWKEGGKPVRDIPKDTSATTSAQILRAWFRSDASNIQDHHVFRWLEVRRINCNPENFDAQEFEKFFCKQFPDADWATERRRATVKRLWNSGKRAGQGEPLTWKQLARMVAEECKATFDVKTIKRDVQDLFSKCIR